jgi:hypothetical protein
MRTLENCRKIRPNKLAAGMSYTAERQGRRVSREANTLCVRGTLDVLARFNWGTRRIDCPCCGHKTGPFRLKKNLNKTI